ncbi:Cysteinyl-tRNA synthetase, mitochondrial [Temnothorax longispinosus]|uniref:Cysteinyl-tRNA synthetase, mitochondrial n=1 Tax=Temnothorax longispinosus TaxID=300112 RepID=A0A4S2KZ19_9HYME|nr:Cysteinyl-tRNA synthetase, mitochondrial [Temnothorax longispinosus]
MEIMNATRVTHKSIRLCKRFVNTEARRRNRPEWVKPVGHQTEVSVYNPITKCKVPLILKTKNILKWYICGPTVYDSAHIGHATLKGDVKMSKSLKNTISIQDYLENYSANHLRMLCLLSHYRNGIEFTDEVMQTAMSVTKKLDNFINDCDNYVAGRFKAGEIDENLLFTTLHDTRSRVYSALADDFDTSKAMHAIINLVRIGNKMLHQDNTPSHSNNVSAVAAVSNYLSNILSKLGISQSTKSTAENRQVEDIIDHFLNFRRAVRIRALEQNPKDTILLKECDNVRKCLSTCGITVKDHQNDASWSWK